MELLKETVFSVVVYILFITIVMNIMKDSGYRPYVELFTGIVLILILAGPLIRLMNMEDVFYHHMGVQEIFMNTESDYVTMEDMGRQLEKQEETQKQKILEQYETAIVLQAQNVLLKKGVEVSDISVTLSEREDDYGEIKEITAELIQEDSSIDTKTTAEQTLKEYFRLKESQICIKTG